MALRCGRQRCQNLLRAAAANDVEVEKEAGLVAAVVKLGDIQRAAERKTEELAVTRNLRLRRRVQGIRAGVEGRVGITLVDVPANPVGAGPPKTAKEKYLATASAAKWYS